MKSHQGRAHPLTQSELTEALKKVPAGHTSVWEHWEEFLKRYSRLDRSTSTIQNVKDCIRLAVVHLELVSLEQFNNILDVEDRLYAYKDLRQIQHSTLNSYQKNLNTYFRWLERYGFIQNNPITKIPRGKETCKEKQIMSEHQITKILYQLSIQRSTSFERARNTLIIHILRVIGARPKEIMAIKMSDISPLKDGSYRLMIRGIKQGGKIRSYRMKGCLKDAYENYLNQRPPNRANETKLFLSRKHGEGFGQKGMRYLFGYLQEELKFKITAYGFRRYVATTLYREGVPIHKISNHLGHSSEKITRTYISDLVDWTDEGVDVLT